MPRAKSDAVGFPKTVLLDLESAFELGLLMLMWDRVLIGVFVIAYEPMALMKGDLKKTALGERSATWFKASFF
jgi:hypothetical protein